MLQDCVCSMFHAILRFLYMSAVAPFCLFSEAGALRKMATRGNISCCLHLSNAGYYFVLISQLAADLRFPFRYECAFDLPAVITHTGGIIVFLSYLLSKFNERRAPQSRLSLSRVHAAVPVCFHFKIAIFSLERDDSQHSVDRRKAAIFIATRMQPFRPRTSTVVHYGLVINRHPPFFLWRP